MSDFERRTWAGTVEIRAEGDKAVAVGYASVFGALSQNLGGFVERVAPGTFAKTIQEADVRALYNHDPQALLGRLRAGTLRLEEDARGLRYEIDLPDTTLGRDVRALILRGDLFGSSFGFRVIPGGETWGETAEGFPMRTLTEVALRDVGPTPFPAYTSSEVALRSLAASRDLDLQALVDAAKRGDLRSLILPETAATEPGETHSVRFNPYRGLR